MEKLPKSNGRSIESKLRMGDCEKWERWRRTMKEKLLAAANFQKKDEKVEPDVEDGKK